MGADLLFLIGGGFLVWLGAEGLVRGAVRLAAFFGISSLIVGLTVVAFGTSAPELVVSAVAAARGFSRIALGNVIGSNLINLCVILGLSAVIAPMAVAQAVLRRDMPVVAGVSLVVLAVALIGDRIGRVDAVILLAVFLIYLAFSIRMAVEDNRRTTMMDGWERPAFRLRDAGMLVGGLAVLVLGAEGMVRGARALAMAMGVSDTVVGMTVVAIGTSIPELAASVVAARHGESDLAIGNVVGSNVFNVTLILGTAALIRPIEETGRSNLLNMVFFISSVFLVYLLMAAGHRLGRAKGMLLLTAWILTVIATVHG